MTLTDGIKKGFNALIKVFFGWNIFTSGSDYYNNYNNKKCYNCLSRESREAPPPLPPSLLSSVIDPKVVPCLGSVPPA